MSDLFKNADPNTIGNSTTVFPRPSPAQGLAGLGEEKTVVKFQPSAQGLRSTDRQQDALQEQEGDPSVLTVSIYATPQNGSVFAGPVTGIALWGTGSGMTNVAEFDIPVMTQRGPVTVPAITPPEGGVQLSVPATSLEIRARDDANFVPPPIIGPNNAIGTIGSSAPGREPVLVTASIAVGVRPPHSRLTRTIWMVSTVLAANGLTQNNSGTINIPPYASSFRVMRNANGSSSAASINVQIGSNSQIGNDGGYNVAAGVLSPEFPLSGQEGTVTITNTDANTILSLAVVFYLNL